MKLQRYDILHSPHAYGMAFDTDGPYVSHDDLAPLLASHAALRALVHERTDECSCSDDAGDYEDGGTLPEQCWVCRARAALAQAAKLEGSDD